MLPDKFLNFCHHIQLLTQSDDFFSESLCILVLEEPCNLMKNNTFSYMMDADISFIKTHTNYQLKLNYLSQMNVESNWQDWKPSPNLILE